MKKKVVLKVVEWCLILTSIVLSFIIPEKIRYSEVISSFCWMIAFLIAIQSEYDRTSASRREKIIIGSSAALFIIAIALDALSIGRVEGNRLASIISSTAGLVLYFVYRYIHVERE